MARIFNPGTWLLAVSVLACWQVSASANVQIEWHDHTISAPVRQRVESLLSQTKSEQNIRLSIGPETKTVDEAIEIQGQQQTDQFRIQVNGQGRGLLYGTYAALEKLGFRFWHPLRPFIPPQAVNPGNFNLSESPSYKARGFTHHTMHPLELAHVLNGWGPKGPADAAGWQSLLPEWQSYLEWLIAHRQNEIEWVLLEKAGWAEFARSPERQARLKKVVELGHAWQVRIGIDAPLSLEQQNGWRLIPKTGDPTSEGQQIRQNLDWLLATDLDFVSTELGTSEFTHGGAAGILSWLNAATDYLASKGKPFFSKIHISTGQSTEDYRDPQTKQPLNINFLPYYADPRLGVMPHTVQFYALDDPAPTYGQQNFSEMHRFMQFTSGKRPMLWFPETAYWVNYDIHVPLFLPVYARQRIHDLRLLQKEKIALEGQMLFSSGWENGYWLNDLLAAESTWNPRPDLKTDKDLLTVLLKQELAPYGPAQAPLTELLLDTMDVQHQLLILGKIGEQQPANSYLRSGIAYLAGQDSWSQLAGLIRSFGLKGFQTQPDRLEFETLQHDRASLELYGQSIAPLLQSMQLEFGKLNARAIALEPLVPTGLKGWYSEFRRGLSLNDLRAQLVYQLMEAAANQNLGQNDSARACLARGLEILTKAEKVSDEADYRADTDRIAGWGSPNPTVYKYGYLWPGRRLFFWKRDWLQVATGNYHPCLLNIIDPLEVALPNPEQDSRAGLARTLAPVLGLQDCFHIHEPDLNLQTLAKQAGF